MVLSFGFFGPCRRRGPPPPACAAPCRKRGGERLPRGDYITLDEGLASGEIEVTELGAALIRRRPGTRPPDSAQVNTLALINHSKKALVLLAGEIVTGGKQDRGVSKDRIIPPRAA